MINDLQADRHVLASIGNLGTFDLGSAAHHATIRVVNGLVPGEQPQVAVAVIDPPAPMEAVLACAGYPPAPVPSAPTEAVLACNPGHPVTPIYTDTVVEPIPAHPSSPEP